MTASITPDAILEPGAIAAYRAEQETQNTIARAHPRNAKKALDEALTELELVPEYACKAFYVIPFKDRSGGQERIVNVEGPSIKASQALSRIWGNNATAWRIKDQNSERIEVEGVYIDHESNVRTLRTKTVSRYYVKKGTGGKEKVLLSDDKLTLAIGAGGSKAVRDATLAGMPVWLVDSYYKKARTIAAKTIGGKADNKKPQTFAEKMEWIVAQLGKVGVEAKTIKLYVDKLEKDWSEDEKIGHMVGIVNAIKDGQTNAAEVFGDDVKNYEKPKSTAEAAGDAVVIDSVSEKLENGTEIGVLRIGERKIMSDQKPLTKYAKAAAADKAQVMLNTKKVGSDEWLVSIDRAA